ncbi:MAG: RluA family pseudouridine synthase [Proteocatella sp.]
MEKSIFVVTEEEVGNRLDQYLVTAIGTNSRSFIQKNIKLGNVEVNGGHKKASYPVEEDDKIEMTLPEPIELDIVAENIPIDIIYEDDDLIVINKAKGMVVHPAPGNYDGTLVNALLYHCKDNLSTINGIKRPGIVHRIDKNTTGVLVVAKNDKAHNFLTEQFKDHTITREYKMIVLGNPKEEIYTVDAPIARNPNDRLKMAVVEGGRRAVTHFRVIKRFDGYSLIKANLETGRTHQIRVHSRHNGYPLLGDDLYYGGSFKFKTQGPALHAGKLGFIHPTTKEYIEFNSELPKYFSDILSKLTEI